MQCTIASRGDGDVDVAAAVRPMDRDKGALVCAVDEVSGKVEAGAGEVCTVVVDVAEMDMLKGAIGGIGEDMGNRNDVVFGGGAGQRGGSVACDGHVRPPK